MYRFLGVLRQPGAGMMLKDLCRWHGFSEAWYCLWRNKFGGVSWVVSGAGTG